MAFFLTVLLVLAFLGPATGSGNAPYPWDYHGLVLGPNDWWKSYPECGKPQGSQPYQQYPQQHPQPYQQHPQPYQQHPQPYQQHPQPYQQHPQQYQPYQQHPQPYQPYQQHPQPYQPYQQHQQPYQPYQQHQQPYQPYPGHQQQQYPQNQMHSQYGLPQQSPIDISNFQVGSQLQSFDLAEYQCTGYGYFTLENAGGHTAKMTFQGRKPVIRGGSLNGDFELEQFHFHWGSTDYQGSEHRLHGQSSPMEMHLVHRQKYTGQVAVLAFLFEMSSTVNVNLDHLVAGLYRIPKSGNMTTIHSFNLAHLLPPNAENGNYYRYTGSFTTPPCTQGVVWTVFEQKIPVAERQMQEFRTKLQTEFDHMVGGIYHRYYGPLVNNFRAPQPLNGRQILKKQSPYGYNPHLIGHNRPAPNCHAGDK